MKTLKELDVVRDYNITSMTAYLKDLTLPGKDNAPTED